MSPTCHKFNEICQLKISEGKKGTWLIYIAGKKKRNVSQAGWTQKLKLFHHNSFLLETQLCSTRCFLLLYCRRASPLVCMPSDSFSHSSCWLGNPKEKEASLCIWTPKEAMPDAAWVSCPHPGLKLYGWQTLWMGRREPSCDIIRKIYLVSASGSWHRAPKIPCNFSNYRNILCFNI